MLKTLFLFVAALVLLNFSQLFSAEITINWRQKLDSGRVSDLKFMPGQNTFIHSTGYETQIRSCENGELIAKYPIKATKYEFTPDSTKLILLNGFHYIQKRNLDDMGLLMEYELPIDSVYYIGYVDIKVDPIRPYIYALWEKTKGIHETYENYTKIQIYDINTLELVSEITDGGNDLDVMAISKDGKYLAAMNVGASYLMVWDLDTRSKVIEKQIGIWKGGNDISEPADIKFSELNTDKIYFTGKFYQTGNAETLEGLCIFSISENRIIDTTFALKPNNFGWNPEICLFENETKVIGTSNAVVRIVNLEEHKIELDKFLMELDNISAYSNIFNKIGNYFIGISDYLINKFQYQRNTSVPLDNKKEVIYPNPTTGIVNIPLNCQTIVTYKIFDINGILLKSNVVYETTTTNLLTIDCSDLSKGVYTIQIICDKTVSLYQIVRGEG